MLLNETLQTEFHQHCDALGLTLPEGAEGQINTYYDCLMETNAVMNLIRVNSPEDFMVRHLLDSLALAPLLPDEGRTLDIGSGGGLPSIPLTIARPDIRMTAVDSVQKKCKFLNDTAKTIGFPPERYTALGERCEDLGQNPKYRGQFDTVTARAVARLPVLLELALPLLSLDGLFIAMKGQSVEEEIKDSKRALQILGGMIEQEIEMDYPPLEGSIIVLVRKIADTPKAYPRKAGTPNKQPL